MDTSFYWTTPDWVLIYSFPYFFDSEKNEIKYKFSSLYPIVGKKYEKKYKKS